MSEPDLPVSPKFSASGALLTWESSRSSGPGGQNVNKVETKIDLRYAFEEETTLTPEEKDRIRALCKGRIDANGFIQVKSQKTRDRKQNLEDARQKLAALLLVALTPKVIRKKTKPSKGAVRRRLGEKRAQGEKKASRKVSNQD